MARVAYIARLCLAAERIWGQGSTLLQLRLGHVRTPVLPLCLPLSLSFSRCFHNIAPSDGTLAFKCRCGHLPGLYIAGASLNPKP